MKITLKILTVFFVSAAFFIFSSCSAVQPRFEKMLGTICFVNLHENGKTAYYDEIFARLAQIDDEFNLEKENSDVSRVNKFAFSENVAVCDDVFAVLETAQKISGLSGGAFDITIEPLVALWRVNTDSPHVATQAELAERLPLVDFRNVALNPSEKSVRFLKEGMKIDLGGIAKGFAADEIAKICKKRKIRRAVIDLGGNVYVYGKKPKNQLWTVGVKNPEFSDEAPLLKVNVPQLSVVTSGMYERFFEADGKRYHHILSPKTGVPIENELYSVTVLCENSMLADALTTTFFVLGKNASLEALPLIQANFCDEISVIFVEKNHVVSFSPDFPFEHTILYEDWKFNFF